MRNTFTYKNTFPVILIALLLVPEIAHAWSLSEMILRVFAFLLGVAGSALDASISYFVIQMGSLISGTSSEGIGVGASINTIWIIVRDLVNLTFIFGLVYVGLRTILDADANTKKMLASIIIGALLVNFSLFITKVVIDVSNVTAAQIYDRMVVTTSTGKRATISEGLMSSMGILQLVTIPNAGEDEKFLQEFKKDGNFHYTLFVVIVMIIAMFVFLAGALLLTIRFGVLIILMMLSPIAFAASVFPAVEGWSRQWRMTLLNQAFFAPAYLFMLYITFSVAQGYSSKMQTMDTVATVANLQNGVSALVFYGVTIVMLVASLIVAKKMGAYGADRVNAWGSKAARFARTTTQEIAGRNTIGRAGDWWQQRQEKRGVPSTSLSSRIASSAANAKFGSDLSRKTIREAGEKAERTRAQRVQEKAISTAIASVQKSKDSDATIEMERKIAGASTDQLVSLLQSTKPGTPEYKEIVHNMSASQFDAVMKAKPEDLDDAAKAALAGARQASVQNRLREAAKTSDASLGDDEALQKGISNASTAQLKALGSKIIIERAADLKQSQIDDIKKSGDFTETEKARILEKRKDVQIKRFEEKPDGFFSKMKNAEIIELPVEILNNTEATKQFTPGMLSAMRDKLDTPTRQNIKLKINSGYGTPEAQAWLKSPRGAEFV